MIRTCSKCKSTKHADYFYFSREGIYRYQCKACDAKDAKSYREENKSSMSLKEKKATETQKLQGICTRSCGKTAMPNRNLCQACSEKCRWAAILRRYGLTQIQWMDLLRFQGNVCALCKEPGDLLEHGGKGKRGPASDMTFVVDHDHTTKTVRGIIHHRCNKAIGLLRDSAAMARMAVEYLERAWP